MITREFEGPYLRNESGAMYLNGDSSSLCVVSRTQSEVEAAVCNSPRQKPSHVSTSARVRRKKIKYGDSASKWLIRRNSLHGERWIHATRQLEFHRIINYQLVKPDAESVLSKLLFKTEFKSNSPNIQQAAACRTPPTLLHVPDPISYRVRGEFPNYSHAKLKHNIKLCCLSFFIRPIIALVWALLCTHMEDYQIIQDQIAWCTWKTYTRHDYSFHGNTSSTSAMLCTAATRHPAARALRQLRRAPRVLVSRPQRHYIDYAVRRRDIVFWVYDYLDYSSRLGNLSRATTTSSTTSRINLWLVEFTSNRRGSITSRRGFVDTRPRIKLSHLFQ
jgi:hypothetical protein